jgi:hypothetical protein
MKKINHLSIIYFGVFVIVLFNGCNKDESESTKQVENPKPVVNLTGYWESQEIGKFEIINKKLCNVTLDYNEMFCGGGGLSGLFGSFVSREVINNKIENAKSEGSMSKLVFSCDFTKYPDVTGTVIIGYRCFDCTTWCEKTVNFSARKYKEMESGISCD